MSDKLTANEITRLLNVLIGHVIPVADSAVDRGIEENLMTAIDAVNWMLGIIYDAASCRKSPYGSAQKVGERAYAALLDWEKWLKEVEEELA